MTVRPLAEVLAGVTRATSLRRRLLPLFDGFHPLPGAFLCVLDALIEADASADAFATLAIAAQGAGGNLLLLGCPDAARNFLRLAEELLTEAQARR